VQAKVFNIPAGQNFARTLAQDLLQQTEGKPEELTRYKIFLPTRRACRVLRDSFLSLNDGKPILLPQMTPLGDVEEEDLALQIFGASERFLDIPSAISPLKRQVLLARMVAANPSFAQGMDQALALAQALGRFMDQVIIEGLDFADLENIVPAEFAAHWQITIDFLKIITENWPAILAENNVIEGAARRNMLLAALADFWQEKPPQGPVIAAGSTGSIPATANLLRVITHLPQGKVILPGLDQAMDEESWGHITETHPQYGLKQLLERINVERKDVQIFGKETQNPRINLAFEMMRPAETTQQWKNFALRTDIPEMLQGLEYYACPTQQEEAQCIALMMRELLQQKETTAALITPDRKLARRVSALCRRWGIEVDDSAGQTLRESNLGKFSLLALSAFQKPFDAVSFLAFLKNELCSLGVEHKADLATLEKNVLRQDLILPDLKTVRSSAENPLVAAFLDKVIQTSAPLSSLLDEAKRHEFSALIAAHLVVLEGFAGAERLWCGDDGEAAAVFFTDLQQNAAYFPAVKITEYIGILDILMKNITIRSPYGVHPRLLILGQLEARLTSADLIILGGLNEKIWPPDIGHDPWLSRPMRKGFGLPPAEKGIGLAAHDFVQGFCAPRVVMTRPERIDGTPSVPARWIQRLEAVLKACGQELGILSQKPYLVWAKEMDHHAQPKSYARPEPRPPLSARPDGISITRVEQWMKDPYGVYAHDVLKLRKIKPLVQESDVALRGSLLHEILDEFIRKYPENLPPDAQDKLVEMGRSILTARLQDQGALRYWWPRFLKIAAWVVEHEEEWRTKAKFLESELEGNADIDIDGQMFNLQGKPDRIDRMTGGYGIIDYKSGAQYKQGKLKSGELPQLPLAALILARGGFDGKGLRNKQPDPAKKRVAAAPVRYLGYWKMTGSKMAGEEAAIEGDIDATIETVEEGLKALVRAFRLPETAYLSVPDTGNAPRYNDYEHLARLKEWAALDEVVDEEAA
jgi:ATP-dependent helicase/nuclease subunit B